jgi:hypothetical protein
MEWKDGSIHYRSQDNFGGCFVPFSPKILADLSLLTPSVKNRIAKDVVDIDRLLWGKFESLAVCLAN